MTGNRYSLWPTNRERDRIFGAARTRSRDASVRRALRRERIIRRAIQRLEDPQHFPHGPEFGWRAREAARVDRMVHAMCDEAYTRGHAKGCDVGRADEALRLDRRAEWELDAARKREAVA